MRNKPPDLLPIFRSRHPHPDSGHTLSELATRSGSWRPDWFVTGSWPPRPTTASTPATCRRSKAEPPVFCTTSDKARLSWGSHQIHIGVLAVGGPLSLWLKTPALAA